MSIPTLAEGMDDASKLIDGLRASDAQADTVARKSLIDPDYPTDVHLPGGYFDLDDQRFQNAVVRELTGRDEEIIGREAARASKDSYGPVLLKILECGVVSVGDDDADQELLDSLFMVDWDVLLLGIFIATFGTMLSWYTKCPECADEYKSNVDLRVVKTKDLGLDDRVFEVSARHEYHVSYPTGELARRGFTTKFKTTAEFTSMLLGGCVQDIDGTPVMGVRQVQDLPAGDRRAISSALLEGGPKLHLEAVKTTCGKCEAENSMTISLAAIFRTRGLGL